MGEGFQGPDHAGPCLVSSTNWLLQSIKSCAAAAAAADFPHPLKGAVGVESRNEALWEKLAEQVFRQIVSGTDFVSPVLKSPHI